MLKKLVSIALIIGVIAFLIGVLILKEVNVGLGIFIGLFGFGIYFIALIGIIVHEWRK